MRLYLILSKPIGASGVQELLPPPDALSDGWLGASSGHSVRRWHRHQDALLLERSLGMARMTNRRIEWLIRQAEGRPRTRETMGQMAARWGVTPRRAPADSPAMEGDREDPPAQPRSAPTRAASHGRTMPPNLGGSRTDPSRSDEGVFGPPSRRDPHSEDAGLPVHDGARVGSAEPTETAATDSSPVRARALGVPGPWGFPSNERTPPPLYSLGG